MPIPLAWTRYHGRERGGIDDALCEAYLYAPSSFGLPDDARVERARDHLVDLAKDNGLH